MINHQDLQKISRESLRKNIAIVLQNTVLFSDTVRHNLKYGNENAEDRQLQETVKMSHCDDLLQGLPKGHDTVLTGSGKISAKANVSCLLLQWPLQRILEF